ncbi:MAG: HAD family hydrolase [Pirellulales bacterium]
MLLGKSIGRMAKQGASPGRIRGLVFDMGDVLYDATVWRRWLLQLLARMGLRTGYRSFYRVWDLDYLDDVHCGRRQYAEAFQAFLFSAGLSWAQIDEVQGASQARRRQLEASLRPLPGVREALGQLHAAGVVLSVLSDSESTATVLEKRLERLGLGGLFCAVISSFDLERTKPDSFCYQTALAAMELEAREVAFVGHDADELAGAAAVGMRTIAYNQDPDAQADLCIERFLEIVDMVGDLNATPNTAAPLRSSEASSQRVTPQRKILGPWIVSRSARKGSVPCSLVEGSRHA